MDVVYPTNDGYASGDGEYPVRSVPFPFYGDFRLGLPLIPDALGDADLVHLHGPFTMGLAGLRFARRVDAPVVASYHTPTAQYANYLASNDRLVDLIGWSADRYEAWMYGRIDALVVPSERARRDLLDGMTLDAPVEVVPNGIDVDTFKPVDPSTFRSKYDLDVDRPLIGYTGRHGFEKRLEEIVEAASDLDVTVVFGGDGPARGSLERLAEDSGADVRFLGFLDRAELPEFYSALDVFVFPSPVETQGIVALESYACGTPVVGADAGALSETVEDGRTGHHYESGDVEGLRDAIRRTLASADDLRENCLERRESVSVSRSIDRLVDVYSTVA